MIFLQSYQTKILLSFAVLILLLASWAFFYSQIDKKNKKLDVLASKVNNLGDDYLTKTRHLQNFLLYGYHEPSFYTNGSQSDIDSFETYLHNNHGEINKLKLQIRRSAKNVNAKIDTLSLENQQLFNFIIELKEIYKAKGYKDFGMEGKMRFYAHILEDSSLIPEISILKLRRSEKDFLLRGELKYANDFQELINLLISKYQNNRRTREALINYQENFMTLVGYNKKIGIYSLDGLYNVIQEQLNILGKRYLQLYELTNETVVSSKRRNDTFLYIGAIFFLCLVIVTIWLLSKYLTKEIKQLNEVIVNFIQSGFTAEGKGNHLALKTLEVRTLYRSFNLLKYRLKNMLEEKASHQKMLVSAVIDGQEKERKNIGAELHDNINPMLATAKLYAGMAINNESERLLLIKTSSEIIDSSIQEIRKLSHTLVGPPGGYFFLQQSIKELLETMQSAVSFSITFTSNHFDESLLNENIKLTLYRILQEQLNNIIKYASAKDIFISIIEKQEELLLTIRDNGIGFDKKLKTKGIGLRNIETRLELVSGHYVLNTSPGDGCEMIISVPLHPGVHSLQKNKKLNGSRSISTNTG